MLLAWIQPAVEVFSQARPPPSNLSLFQSSRNSRLLSVPDEHKLQVRTDRSMLPWFESTRRPLLHQDRRSMEPTVGAIGLDGNLHEQLRLFVEGCLVADECSFQCSRQSIRR